MTKLFANIDNPFVQVGILSISCLLLQLFLLALSTDSGDHQFYHWIISASILLLYAFFNAVYLLKAEHLGTYLRNALYGFLLLLIFCFVLARAFSHLGDLQSTSMKWIFFTISFSYVIFLMIAYFMRRIIEYAQRQDSESKS